jgi:hypothetical protein
MLRSTLRFAAGAIVGTLLWSWCGDAYHAVLARFAEPVVNIDSRLRHAEVRGAGSKVNARGDEEEPSLPRVIIPADQLTYNVILFLALFAMNRGLFRKQSLQRFAIAMAVLFAVHVLALAVSIEATYASRVTGWSNDRYGPLEQDFWTAAEYAYRLAGMAAVAFGCWWMTVTGASEVRKGREQHAA